MDGYALVIGISEYSGSGFRSLTKPVKDAEAVAQTLEKHSEFGVIRLPRKVKEDEESYEVVAKNLPGATLKKRIKQFLTEDAANKNALIYFSGHGFTAEDHKGDRIGFLAPSDCSVELDEDRQVIEQHNGIPLDLLNNLISQSKVSSLVMILDCCNSGYFLESFSVRKSLTEFKFEKDYYLITACGASQKAFEGKEYSILTGALLRGLGTENAKRSRKGRITGDLLFDFISGELVHSRQEPLRMGWGHSIVIARHDLSTLGNDSINFPINNDDPKGLEKSWADNAVSEKFNPENPYLGLQAFEFEQAVYFGGREKAVRALLDHLTENRFLAVIGASGCGKSSLVKAGLLPELKRDLIPSSQDWQIEFFRVSQNPHPASAWAKMLTQKNDQQTFLVFIDQVEELFTLCPDETERQEIIEAIAQTATDPQSQARIILAIRADFLDRLAQYPTIAALLNRSTQPSTYVVSPLTLPELEEAIEKPAKQHGVAFESGLVAQIAWDVQGQAGGLPQLQYALRELWQECIQGEGRQLTLEGYETIGGVEGALQKRAETLYETFPAPEQGVIQQLMLAMVESAETEHPTRRPISWKKVEEIADLIQFQPLINRLSNERLLVTDDHGLQVAHEALFSKWSRCAEWIAENRDNISRQRRLERDCQEWLKSGKNHDYLLRRGRLAEFETWQPQLKLLETEIEFLRESRLAEDERDRAELRHLEELVEKETENRKLAVKNRNWAIAGTILAMAAFAGSFLGFTQQRWAKQVVLANFFGVSQPEQVQQILSDGVTAFDDVLKEASQLKGKNNEAAIQHYRQIRQKIYARLDEVGGLQKDAKTEEETAKLKGFQKILKDKLPQTEKDLIELIEEYRIQKKLQEQLKQKNIGEPLTENVEPDPTKRFSPGALRTTYEILMIDIGADINGDGLVSSFETETKRMPCPTLKSIQKMWRDNTDGCTWRSPCQDLNGKPLKNKLFDLFDQSAINKQLTQCSL